MPAATLDVLIAESPGSSMKIPYNDRQPISFLMYRISRKLGEKDEEIRERKLYMNGIPLQDDDESVARCRVFGNLLTYRSKKRNPQRGTLVFVKIMAGNVFSLDCGPQWTVDDVKASIQDREGVPSHQQILVYAGKQLEDTRTLKDYKVQNESMMRMILRLCGGGSAPVLPGILFTDVSDTKGVGRLEFSTSGPRGRSVSSGTNVECQCNCTPGYRVICQKGFGIVELSSSSFKCPNCRGSEVVPVTVGFVRCKYRFHGIKATGERYTSEWKDVIDSDRYQHFEPSNQISWRRLVIESDKLGSLEECAICLEPMSETTSLSCGHRYHSDCLSQWSSSCPNCRFNPQLVTG
ncbi:hypothetical protein B0O80DRAFT_423508 [Mortierella sp. GBAus27b]|nr:hypothetical protein B0O80DRAFT_423508 [Mortierella sp. GBAus27b]